MNLKGWTKDAASCRSLTDPPDEQVDIVHRLVDLLHLLDNLARDQVGQSVKALGFPESAQFSESIVTLQPVVSSSLDIERHKIQSKVLVLWLEEVVGDLVRQDIIKLLTWLGGKPDEELVQVAGGVEQLRVQELLVQGQNLHSLSCEGDIFHQPRGKI